MRVRVMSIPTALILRDGREVERLDGLIKEADLAVAFERAGKHPIFTFRSPGRFRVE